jgi:hypothetical protein
LFRTAKKLKEILKYDEFKDKEIYHLVGALTLCRKGLNRINYYFKVLQKGLSFGGLSRGLNQPEDKEFVAQYLQGFEEDRDIF